ncbi:antitoxin [Paenarthrobacter sp. Z7-10]|nr:antitoxin [Paenarthrobacter sp. Z7-10]
MPVSIFDDIKGKATDLITHNEAALKNGIGKAGDFIDSKTGDKFKDRIESVQNAAGNFVDHHSGTRNATGERSVDEQA